jgi:UDP-N-acetylglucosamine--N-acetylmuramyl-(pentapeptide) pyrophosphoryl-undecaprenol N-acetylglucosamine transferase
MEPHLILGTGGYAAGPALAWGRLTGRALVLQEQNAHPGMVTRVAARWAEQVHLGFPEAREELATRDGAEVFAFGNPVAPPGPGPSSPYDWPEGRVVLVAGGSQGAAGLNRRLLADLREVRAWPTDLSLVWIAGRDHAGELRRDVQGLPFDDRIRVEPYIEDLGRQLSGVSLAISRAGAMFVSELAAAGVPSVLVPYPAAAGGHQRANARALADAGAAVVREEGELTDGQLWRLASRLVADRDRLEEMSRAAGERGAPDAAGRIAGEVLRLARSRGAGDGTTGAEGGGHDG